MGDMILLQHVINSSDSQNVSDSIVECWLFYNNRKSLISMLLFPLK